MIGTLLTIIVVMVGLVVRYDPEARRGDDREQPGGR